jgi:hypothetical protein
MFHQVQVEEFDRPAEITCAKPLPAIPGNGGATADPKNQNSGANDGSVPKEHSPFLSPDFNQTAHSQGQTIPKMAFGKKVKALRE